MSESFGPVDSVPIFVTDDVSQVGTWLTARAGQMAEQLAALSTQLDPIRETWSGLAAGNYEALQLEWNIAAEALFAPDGLLGVIARAMDTTWDNYRISEAANVKTWQH